MLSGLLKDPAQDDDDRAAFTAYASALAELWWPRIGLLLAAACLLWWSLDAWVFPHSTAAQDALGTLRLQLVVLDPLLALFLPVAPLARRCPQDAASLAALLNLVLGGWCLAQLDGGGVLGIAYAYLVPQFSMLLLVPFGARVGHLLLWTGVLWTTWLAHPDTSFATPGALASLSYFAFAAFIGLFVGHAVYALLQRNFHLNLQVKRQRTALATVAEHLEPPVAEQTVAIRIPAPGPRMCGPPSAVSSPGTCTTTSAKSYSPCACSWAWANSSTATPTCPAPSASSTDRSGACNTACDGCSSRCGRHGSTSLD